MEHNNIDKNIKLIKDSFESSHSKAPEFIWENLDKQLYIDRIWMKLKVQLDNIQSSRIRMKYFLYSTGIILLIIFAGSYYFIKQQHYVNVSNSENTKLKTIIPLKNNLNISINNITHCLENKSDENKTKVKSLVFIVNEAEQVEIIDTLKKVYKDSTHLNRIQINTSNQFYSELSIIENQILHDSLYLLEPKEIQALYFNYEDIDKQIRFPEFSIDTSIQNRKYYSANNEIGLIYSLNNTMLINNDFAESNRAGSMVSIVPTIASSYGLIYNYKFSKSNVLSFECYFLSNQNQHAHLYLKGKYFKKTIKLDYSKMVILYQRNISFNCMKPFSWYIVKAGGYFSILTKNDIYYVHNDEITDMPTMISNNDYGVKLCIGREREMKNFIIGGGFQSEYGLKNIFKGDENIPSDFNRTNNFSHGLFVTLKLKY